MTRPKLNLQLPLTTASVAFLSGMALVLYQPGSPKTATVHMSADTTPTTSTPATTSMTTTASTYPSDTSSPATSPTQPTGSSSAIPSTSSTAATTSGTSADTSSPAQSDPAPAVTAVSAVPGDWSAPVPSSIGTTPVTMQTQYCTYTYSDGTTQTVPYATKTTYASGSPVEAVDDVCTVSDAPAGV